MNAHFNAIDLPGLAVPTRSFSGS